MNTSKHTSLIRISAVTTVIDIGHNVFDKMRCCYQRKTKPKNHLDLDHDAPTEHQICNQKPTSSTN